MAKVKKRRLRWEPSTSSNIIGYKLYWAEEGGVNYDSPCAMIGNVAEVVLPEQVPSFPIVKGSIELGITAINEIGNESDMATFSTPFQFSVPDAPTRLGLEALKEYHICLGSSTDVENGDSANDTTRSDLEADPDNPPSSVPSAREVRRDSRFIAYDNGTVIDTQTNLMWAAKDNGDNINWQDAKNYCENYRGGGYTDWRMPTQDELERLYDRSVKSNTGYHLTTLMTLTACSSWASETHGSEAAIFDFYFGERYWPPQSNNVSNRALPVRSVK